MSPGGHAPALRWMVSAALAYQFSRRGEAQRGAKASERSVEELVRVLKAELAEEDKPAYTAAAVRVGASRHAVEPAVERPGSVRRSAQGTAVTVAVQMLESWTELWVFHQEGGAWVLDTVAPAATEPVLGYVELAGFSPDGSRVLVAREALVEGRVKSSFQMLKRETLMPEKSAERVEDFGSFQRWSSADWRGRTVAVR